MCLIIIGPTLLMKFLVANLTFLAFLASPTRVLTTRSKIFLSIFITISLVSILLPISLIPLPSHLIPFHPNSLADNSINFLTLSCLQLLRRSLLVYLAENFPLYFYIVFYAPSLLWHQYFLDINILLV